MRADDKAHKLQNPAHRALRDRDDRLYNLELANFQGTKPSPPLSVKLIVFFDGGFRSTVGTLKYIRSICDF